MICEACRDRRHGECPGGSWCDCQHLPPAGPAGTGATASDTDADTDAEAEAAERAAGEGGVAEPAVNWLRQG